MPQTADLLDILACPVCAAELHPTGTSLTCQNAECLCEFPAVEGVPVLINDAASIFDTTGFVQKQATFFKSHGWLREWLSARIPDLSGNVSARQNFARLRELLHERTERTRVLVVGGSIVGAGMDALLEDDRIELVETDAAWGPRTQVICDAHHLPFKDQSFDAVIVQAVLEHVVDPIRCVDECYRVLKPAGLVYADTPFIQQVHGREYDFTRFTRLGHRRLFRRFSEVSSGITCGPGMALAWTVRYFLMSFFTSRRMRAAVSGLSRLGLFWLKYFDYYLCRKQGALDAASAFFFLGRKSDQVLSDRELLSTYQGGF